MTTVSAPYHHRITANPRITATSPQYYCPIITVYHCRITKCITDESSSYHGSITTNRLPQQYCTTTLLQYYRRMTVILPFYRRRIIDASPLYRQITAAASLLTASKPSRDLKPDGRTLRGSADWLRLKTGAKRAQSDPLRMIVT